MARFEDWGDSALRGHALGFLLEAEEVLGSGDRGRRIREERERLEREKEVALEAEAEDRASEPFLGFGFEPGFEGGVRVNYVIAGSPADAAGLEGLDVIVRVDGKNVANLEAFRGSIREKKVGDRVVLTVRRGARELRLDAVLGRRGDLSR
jgi:S1-C subfamily serine protease